MADGSEVHVGTPVNTCREVNARRLAGDDKTEPYSEDDFENLVFRYEEPNGMARWDSPLFTVIMDDATPPLDQIWEAMVGSDGQAKTVRPNAATVLVSSIIPCPRSG
jgi:protein KTI12